MRWSIPSSSAERCSRISPSVRCPISRSQPTRLSRSLIAAAALACWDQSARPRHPAPHQTAVSVATRGAARHSSGGITRLSCSTSESHLIAPWKSPMRASASAAARTSDTARSCADSSAAGSAEGSMSTNSCGSVLTESPCHVGPEILRGNLRRGRPQPTATPPRRPRRGRLPTSEGSPELHP